MFKVGDYVRVIVNNPYAYGPKVGAKGSIIKVDISNSLGSDYYYNLLMDKPVSYIGGNNRMYEKKIWMITHEFIELIFVRQLIGVRKI